MDTHTRRPPARRAAALPAAPLLAAALLVAGCQSDVSEAMPGGGTTVDETETIRGLELDRLGAMVGADLPALEEIHAEEFELVPPPGVLMTRDEYHGAIDAGDIDYVALEPEGDITVRADGALAVVTYRARMHLDVDGMGELDHDSWVTVVYEHGPDGWRAVREQATAVNGF